MSLTSTGMSICIAPICTYILYLSPAGLSVSLYNSDLSLCSSGLSVCVYNLICLSLSLVCQSVCIIRSVSLFHWSVCLSVFITLICLSFTLVCLSVCTSISKLSLSFSFCLQLVWLWYNLPGHDVQKFEVLTKEQQP